MEHIILPKKKRYVKGPLTFFCLVLLLSAAFAQETVIQTRKLSKDMQEVANVLKTNPDIKQGLYQVRYHKTIALASGLYSNNKKVGVWHFFDYKNTLVQNYDYDNNRLMYEAPDDQVTDFTYTFDKGINDTDRVTKPIRIGGRYYGYLPYLNLFVKPDEVSGIDNDNLTARIELLISPGGFLADYSINLSSFMLTYKRVLSVNLNRLTDEEKQFIPATINHEAVSSRIIIFCRIAGNGKLTFMGLN